jgi:hypothetical protein
MMFVPCWISKARLRNGDELSITASGMVPGSTHVPGLHQLTPNAPNPINSMMASQLVSGMKISQPACLVSTGQRHPATIPIRNAKSSSESKA